jgi:uncharacterized protein YcbK (DUF882 family)
MISFKELLSGNTVADVTINHLLNLYELAKAINIVREAYGKPMVVTSGYRTLQHHLEIYSRKGIHPPKVPMQSNHLSGRAVDIFDPDGALMKFCLNNVELLERAGLWCEAGTDTWVHFQTIAPKSGRRFFNA